MIDFLFLIPIALMMGLAGLCAFLWSVRNGQYEDLEGASVRILIEDDAPAARDRASAEQSVPTFDAKGDDSKQQPRA
jgi:cytochrome oxidase maturation protein, cbb3-type